VCESSVSPGIVKQKVSEQLISLLVKILDDQFAANILSQISDVVAQFRSDKVKESSIFYP